MQRIDLRLQLMAVHHSTVEICCISSTIPCKCFKISY